MKTGLVLIAIWIVAIIGWVINLVNVVKLAIDNVEFTTLFIVQVVGIFFGPLGSILGWFSIF
jgi:hypothetical protein